MATRALPPLLEQYLGLPPEASLIVLTGVLGASTNWLVLRHLSGLLRPPPPPGGHRPAPAGAAAAAGGDWPGAGAAREQQQQQQQGGTRVLLVSFLRGFEFWRDGAGRLGMDLESLSKKGRFSFVDGLTGLFAPPTPPPPPGSGGGGARTARRLVWGKAGLRGVAATLHEAVDDLLAASGGGEGNGPTTASRVVLVVDQPDLLLAAAGAEVSVEEMQTLLLSLREKVHATIVTLSADEPLISPQRTSLEREHASLVLSLAHKARAVLSLRLLDTGAAGDVSGVVRITRGGAGCDDDPGDRVEEHEYLYHVGGDGGVKVFGRGQ